MIDIENENLSDRQRHILRLWESGLTSYKIAEELAMTRSAVMGAVLRLRRKGLVTRRHDVDQTKRILKEAVTGAPPDKRHGPRRRVGAYHKPKDLSPRITLPHFALDKEKKAPRIGTVFPVRGDEITITKLTRFKCRFINGEVDAEDTLYCGRKVTRGVYCAEHALLCYHTPVEKNAVNAPTKSAPTGRDAKG